METGIFRPYMSVKVVEEAGYSSALLGLSFNKKQNIEKMGAVAEKLCNHDGGHNKFLEHMYVWLDVRTTRYIWSEMDTVRISSKSSESTMHTLLRGPVTPSDFEVTIPEEYLNQINRHIEQKNLLMAKALLPECFLQRRMWCLSYKTLRNIILQRRNHRLPHWRIFIAEVLTQVKFPNLLPWVV